MTLVCILLLCRWCTAHYCAVGVHLATVSQRSAASVISLLCISLLCCWCASCCCAASLKMPVTRSTQKPSTQPQQCTRWLLWRYQRRGQVAVTLWQRLQLQPEVPGQRVLAEDLVSGFIAQKQSGERQSWAVRALHRHNAVTAVSPSGWGQDDARILTRTKVHPPISSLSMISLQRERAPKHQFKH